MLFTNHDSFLSELSKLFEVGRQNGKSVWITMKRYDGRKTRNPRKPNDKPKRPKKGVSKTPICESGDLMPNEYKCLIRAKLGNKRISVAVGHKDMNKFQVSYSNLIKGNIYGLKKQTQKSTATSSTGQTTISTTTQQNPSSSTTTTSSKGSGGGGGGGIHSQSKQ